MTNNAHIYSSCYMLFIGYAHFWIQKDLVRRSRWTWNSSCRSSCRAMKVRCRRRELQGTKGFLMGVPPEIIPI